MSTRSGTLSRASCPSSVLGPRDRARVFPPSTNVSRSVTSRPWIRSPHRTDSLHPTQHRAAPRHLLGVANPPVSFVEADCVGVGWMHRERQLGVTFSLRPLLGFLQEKVACSQTT